MDGTERSVLVKDNLGLPNGLTFDSENQKLCWADAGETLSELFNLDVYLIMFTLITDHSLIFRDS